jgi:hypothetical protein
MTCLRCDGLMVHEKFEDLDGLWSSDHEFTGWRCLNCGAIVDPVIAAHKRITSSQRNTLLYQTLAYEAHPFNPIQEVAPC